MRLGAESLRSTPVVELRAGFAELLAVILRSACYGGALGEFRNRNGSTPRFTVAFVENAVTTTNGLLTRGQGATGG